MGAIVVYLEQVVVFLSRILILGIVKILLKLLLGVFQESMVEVNQPKLLAGDTGEG